MTVNRRAKPKNDSATETARVMRVFDMIVDELGRRTLRDLNDIIGDFPVTLEIADRIAARTEDPQ